MTIGDFASGFFGSYSNVQKMRGLQMQMKAQERMQKYREDVNTAMMRGDVKGALDLSMAFGDAPAAKMFKAAHDDKTARDFDRLARTDPEKARTDDPTRWAQWKAGEQARTTQLKQGQATLAHTRALASASEASRKIALETHKARMDANLTAREDKKLSQISGLARAGWIGNPNNPADIEKNLPALNRQVKQNPELFRKLHATGKDRVPQRYMMVNTPNGPRLTLEVFNKRTNSKGPATDRQGKAKDENVITVDARTLYQRLGYFASGGKTTKGDWTTIDVQGPDGKTYRMPFNKHSGQADKSRAALAPKTLPSLKVVDVGGGEKAIMDPSRPNKPMTRIELSRKQVADGLSKYIKDSFKISDFQSDFSPKDKKTNMVALRFATDLSVRTNYGLGKSKQLVGRLIQELQSDSPEATAFHTAKSVQDQNAALTAIYRRIMPASPKAATPTQPQSQPQSRTQRRTQRRTQGNAELQPLPRRGAAGNTAPAVRAAPAADEFVPDPDWQARNRGRSVPPDDGSDY